MDKTKVRDLSLELCKTILDQRVVPNDSAENYYLKSFHCNNNQVSLEMSDGKDVFIFCLEVAYKQGNLKHLEKQTFFIKEDDVVVQLKDVALKEYRAPCIGEIGLSEVRLVLKTLASQCTSITRKTIEEKYTFLAWPRKKKLLRTLLKLSEPMENIDTKLLENGIKTLLIQSEEVLNTSEENLYICGSIFQKKPFFKYSLLQSGPVECKLLPVETGKPVAEVYNALSVIFYSLDQNKKQRHFHELLDLYYNVLTATLTAKQIDIDKFLPMEVYQSQIHKYLPYVKVELLFYKLKEVLKELNFEDNEAIIIDYLNSNYLAKSSLWSSIKEVYEYILYPMINREDCYKILSNALIENYEDLSYKVEKTKSAKGLIGEFSNLEITVKQNSITKKLHLFIKHLAIVEGFQDMIISLYDKETFIYNILVPDLKRNGFEDVTDFLPSCYLTVSNKMFVLQDMSALNYLVLDSEPYTYQQLSVIVKQLAKFHACSLLYEEFYSKKYGSKVRLNEAFPKYFHNTENLVNEYTVKTSRCAISSITNYIFDLFPEVPKKISMDEFKRRATVLLESSWKNSKKSSKYRNVLCHGDIWAANILLHSDNDGNAESCCFIDFQIIQYELPTGDLLTLFYQSTDKNTRSQYMAKLIDEYYTELSRILERYNIDLNEIYSRSVFMECCDYTKPGIVCEVLNGCQYSLRRDIIQSLKEDKKKLMHFNLVDRTPVLKEIMKDEKAKARFKELVEDLYDICISIL